MGARTAWMSKPVCVDVCVSGGGVGVWVWVWDGLWPTRARIGGWRGQRSSRLELSSAFERGTYSPNRCCTARHHGPPQGARAAALPRPLAQPSL